jgi:hypothetical protein
VGTSDQKAQTGAFTNLAPQCKRTFATISANSAAAKKHRYSVTVGNGEQSVGRV